jgi:hypothetical protein
LKLAETYYKKAIKQAQFPVEANYYLGLLYKYKIKNSKKASSCLDTSFKYVIKGYKQQDIYVELFDEVYYLQIKEEIENKILIK